MEYLDNKELRKLFEVAYKRNRAHHLLLVTIFWQGSRVSETLELEGIDVRDGRITIDRKKGSVETSHEVHFDPDPLFDGSPILQLAAENPGRLFNITRYGVDKLIKRYGKVAGIPPEKCHVHALKHSSGIIFWEASGGNLGLLQRHLGHKSASSSLIYLYESDAKKASAIMSAVRI